MFEILFYIPALLIVISAMVVAFSLDLRRILLFSAAMIFSFAAMLVMLKAQLLALVLIAVTGLSVLPTAIHFRNQSVQPAEELSRKFKLMLLPILALSAASAIITSLNASTRFLTISESSYDYTIIFSAYLPLIFLILLLVSVVVRLVIASFRKEPQS